MLVSLLLERLLKPLSIGSLLATTPLDLLLPPFEELNQSSLMLLKVLTLVASEIHLAGLVLWEVTLLSKRTLKWTSTTCNSITKELHVIPLTRVSSFDLLLVALCSLVLPSRKSINGVSL